MTNNWRAIAKMARDRIVVTDPGDVGLILNLWYIRLSALARLRLFSQTTAECNNLFNALTSASLSPLYEYIRTHLLPFELLVLKAKTRYWAGDHMGYLDELTGLLGWCKSMARRACAKRDEAAVGMWKERGARLCLIMASQLIEMKDYASATRLLSSLSKSSPTLHLEAAIMRTHLQSGLFPMAAEHLQKILSSDPEAPLELKVMSEALMKSAEGRWSEVEIMLKEFIEVEKQKDGQDAINNLAVALLSQGKLKEATQVLEETLRQSPSTIVAAEPFLFNLATLYELRSITAPHKKRELLLEVAKWGGDGLRTTCLKMPIN
ncbi:hypothetical protein K474DRAFT_1599988 [Panus rudis PR-1116 ss-1]|nr:hypothetical protein K474DRAFT_1599988 [Panus rudis PR-1116 ss-1]